MGNELFSNYSIDKESFASGGHCNLWKIYNAIHKESKKDYCLFVFEKKTLDQFPQSEREELLSLLRQEVSCLSNYDHRSILSIVELLVEDKYSMGFITEPFSHTLSSWLIQASPSQLEIKVAIKELCHVIHFLHNKCHIIHNNLNPDVIFIDKENRIKLSGMSFVIDNSDSSSGDAITLNSVNGHFNQNLNYIAPEVVYQSKAYYSSDVYSIGLLILRCISPKDKEALNMDKNLPVCYKKNCPNTIESYLSRLTLDKEDNEILIAALNQEESKRPKINDLIQYAWLTDYKVQALSFIENLSTNDISKNYEFLKCLPCNLTLFDSKIITKRFLPALLRGLKVEALINPILPAIFTICNFEGITVDFELMVWPQLKEVFLFKTIPTASLYLLLTKITIIGDSISNKDFSTYCFSLILKAMDCGVSKIQSVISDKLPFISDHIDSQALIKDVYPRIMQIILNTQSSSLKEKLFASLKELLPILDNKTINEKMLVDLEKIRKKDTSYQTIQGMVVIYEAIGKVVSIDGIVNKIIPSLVGIMSNGVVSMKLYDRINDVLQGYFKQIRLSRIKDFCNDEDYVDINDVSSIDSPEKKSRKDKDKDKDSSNGEGMKLLTFFGGNEGETAQLYSSSNNNSTTMNTTFSEVNGDYYSTEDHVANINKRTEFIDSMTNPKMPTQIMMNTNHEQLNQSKKEKILKIEKVKTDEKDLFDSLLNDNNKDDEDEDEMLTSSKGKTKPKKISPKTKREKNNPKKKVTVSSNDNIIESKKEVKTQDDIDLLSSLNNDSAKEPPIKIEKVIEPIIPTKKKGAVAWEDDEDEDNDISAKVINKEIPMTVSAPSLCTTNLSVNENNQSPMPISTIKASAWDEDEEDQDDTFLKELQKTKQEQLIINKTPMPEIPSIINTSPVDIITSPLKPLTEPPSKDHNDPIKETNKTPNPTSIKKSSTSKKPTIKKKKQSIPSKQENLLDLESLLD